MTRGKVAVSNSEQNSKQQAAYLLPNNQLNVSRLMGGYERHVVDAELLVAWTTGSLNFDNETLATVAVLLGKKFDVSVRIGSKDLSPQRITAKFGPGEMLDDVLNNLSLATGFIYKNIENQIVITDK